MNKLGQRSLLLMLALLLAFTSASMAFADVHADEAEDILLVLREKGVIQSDGQSFQGDRMLTHAEGLTMIVRGMGLLPNSDGSAEASRDVTDHFDRVAADDWYAAAYSAALHNGLNIPRDVEPNRTMNREQFLHMLFQALAQTGDYPFTMRLFILADEEDVDPAYSHAIQMMLNGGFAKLDEAGKLYPKQEISRREAAVTLHAVMTFKSTHDQLRDRPDAGGGADNADNFLDLVFADKEAGGPDAGEDVAMTRDNINDEVVKVTLSRGEKPHAGYGIDITAVVFREGIAEIQYRLYNPEPDRMYAQVITTPEATTFLSAEYEVVLKQVD